MNLRIAKGLLSSILVDNTHIRSSFYTINSQPDISDVSLSQKRSLRLVEMTEIQASLLQSPLLPRLVEDGDRRCDSLNITVSVCYASGSKVNRKERSRPSLFVCFFVPPC